MPSNAIENQIIHQLFHMHIYYAVQMHIACNECLLAGVALHYGQYSRRPCLANL